MNGRPGDVNSADRKFRYRKRRNGSEFSEFEWARSATKHGISRPQSRFVVERATWRWEKHPPVGGPQKDLRMMFFGDDCDGAALEVFGVKLGENRLSIIHVMLLRPRFHNLYEEASDA